MLTSPVRFPLRAKIMDRSLKTQKEIKLNQCCTRTNDGSLSEWLVSEICFIWMANHTDGCRFESMYVSKQSNSGGDNTGYDK